MLISKYIVFAERFNSFKHVVVLNAFSVSSNSTDDRLFDQVRQICAWEILSFLGNFPNVYLLLFTNFFSQFLQNILSVN
jgi:hypothetical protein